VKDICRRSDVINNSVLSISMFPGDKRVLRQDPRAHRVNFKKDGFADYVNSRKKFLA